MSLKRLQAGLIKIYFSDQSGFLIDESKFVVLYNRRFEKNEGVRKMPKSDKYPHSDFFNEMQMASPRITGLLFA